MTNELVEKCKEKYPAANKDFVTKKIHSMRCSFRREYKKIANVKKKWQFSGSCICSNAVVL